MSPKDHQNIDDFHSGDSIIITDTVKDKAGAVVNLTGASVEFRLSPIKRQGFESTAKVTKTVGSGITLIDPTNGIMTVTLDPADTADLAGRFYYEIQVTDASDNVATVTTGIITIKTDLVT